MLEFLLNCGPKNHHLWQRLRSPWRGRVLLLWGLMFPWSWLAQAADETAKNSDTPRPSVTVSLEQSSLREMEPVQMIVWILNDSTQSLSGVQLHIDGPSFLAWRDGGCNGRAMTNSL